MPNPFIEERLPVDIRMGATYSEGFEVGIDTTSSGQEYRYLHHPFPARDFVIHYTGTDAAVWDGILDLYYRAFGPLAGFRVRCLDDFSTAGMTGSPTAFDQSMALVSTGVYQLQKAYGLGGLVTSLGNPVRTLFKPVAGTVAVAIGGVVIRSADWSVDTTTGRVTFAADQAVAIAGISKATQAVVTVPAGHGLVAGQAVVFSAVTGMTQINGLRGIIMSAAATTVTVAINSSAFSSYTSGGTLHTRPQSGETVSGGCEFDLPCRFNSRVDVTHVARYIRETGNIDLKELLTL